MPAPRKYPQELRERAVRLARESDRPLAQIAKDLGVHREALRTWVRQDEAARSGDGLAVGDIVVAGSPGMHVITAAELNVDARHVWAGHADGDAVSGWLGSVPGIHDNEPTDPSFGANRYQVDTSGHSGYWQPGSVSLNNQAAIVVGDYSLVKLEHGMVPQ